MPKKIFDIIPPQKNVLVNDSLKKSEVKPEKPKKRPSFKKKLLFIPILAIFIGAFVHFSFSKANVEIWPDYEILTFEKEIIIDSQANQVNLSTSIIPGRIVEEESEASGQFSSSGSVSKKAEGIIRVYNAYSTSSQVLIVKTRFVSATGKLFRIPEKIVVPGGHYEKGKLVPGYIDVKVIADQPGEDYNIEPTTFSIPGFAGTAKFTFFYAKSFETMSGGGIFPQVVQEDLDNAQKSLLGELKKQGRDSLLSKAGSELILLEESLEQEIASFSSSEEAGSQAERFTYKLRIKSSSLALEKQELKDFFNSYISSQISEPQKLFPESLKISHSLKSIDRESIKAVILAESSGKVYYDVDILSLEDILRNKLLDEAKILLNNQPEIISFQIKAWPFWLKRIPKDNNRIDIEIKIDPEF